MPSSAFTSASVFPVLQAACDRAGFSADGAELLRIGENAIWRLDGDPVVVRIARRAERLPTVRKELCVARWLAAAGVPVIRVADVLGQPLVVNGHPVSFWVLADGVGPSPSSGDLARLLKSFHAVDGCPCGLPRFDPLPVSRNRLAHARAIDEDDLAFLNMRCRRA